MIRSGLNHGRSRRRIHWLILAVMAPLGGCAGGPQRERAVASQDAPSLSAQIDDLSRRVDSLDKTIPQAQSPPPDRGDTVKSSDIAGLRETVKEIKAKIDKIYICPQRKDDAISLLPCDNGT
jgi:hypothetical protein